MTRELMDRLFRVKEKSGYQAGMDMLSWASYTIKKAHDLYEAGAITAKERTDSERQAATVQRYAYEVQGINYL